MKFYVFDTSSDKVSVNYSLLLGLLNTEHKPSVKKKQNGRPGRSVTGQPAWILNFTGRVEKILTGPISGSYYCECPRAG